MLKELVIETSPVADVLLYTADSYAKAHGGRTVQDDQLTLQKLTLPNGQTAMGVKALLSTLVIVLLSLQSYCHSHSHVISYIIIYHHISNHIIIILILAKVRYVL